MAYYKLVRWVVRRNKNGTANVHLHGKRKRILNKGFERHIDYLTAPILPQETDAEIVRCAVKASPHRYTIDLCMDMRQFGFKFYFPLSRELKQTVQQVSLNASTGARGE
jgi:hypothetical protein